MTYVKKSAQIFLVDDSEVDKYKQNGFNVYTPAVPKAPEAAAKAGAKNGSNGK